MYEIDGKKGVLDKEMTIMQACVIENIDVPRFCYHEKLSIAGNCRMCLVEVAKPLSLKPVAACAVPILNGMQVYTNSSLVKYAREGVLEFLLANHPLDCPICDQGGECDLQDQVMVFGGDRGRFYEVKRAVLDKNFGVLVKTIMTRCIHCTRCVRFLKEVAGVSVLGVLGRGFYSEIGTYLESLLDSEISGNIIDLCPVGALTAKPFAFTARTWELKSVFSLDVFDSFCSNIRVDFKGDVVFRILPRLNENINEEWITDRIRFSYDGIRKQRILYPYVNIKGSLVKFTWNKVYSYLMSKLDEYKSLEVVCKVILGDLLDLDSLVLLKDFNNKMGSGIIYNTVLSDVGSSNVNLDVDFRKNYFLNIPFKDLIKFDTCILLNSNLRVELPLLNVRLRKRVMGGSFSVFVLGSTSNLGYKTFFIGNSVNSFVRFVQGKHVGCNFIVRFKNVLMLYGTNLLFRKDKVSLFSISSLLENCLNRFKIDLNISYIFNNSTFLNLCELGMLNSAVSKKVHFENALNLCYFVNVMSSKVLKDISNKQKGQSLFIYQGSYGSIDLSKMDVVLPNTIFFEKSGGFLNLNGYLQFTNRVVFPYKQVRNDIDILCMFSNLFFKRAAFGDFRQIHNYVSMRLLNVSPLLGQLECRLDINRNFFGVNTNLNIFKFVNSFFFNIFVDYFNSNVISRVSLNMISCKEQENRRSLNF